ncbi:MAG TPA: Spy/CpxP family protein refolding chaperone [Caulobacteraceae bacterium]|nr:Spy/CpxP family protein refolding chaperone [Caulobacteraceae bacterium]
MKLIFPAAAALAASAAVLAFAGATFGQDQQAGPRQPPTAEQRQAWRQQHQAEAAQRLTAVLNLRPDQQGALQTFLAAMHASHDGREGHRHDGDQGQQLTTPQRLDRMAEMMTRREAAFHQRADAVRAFYATLSPEQQRAFDALPSMLGGGHDHDRGGEHRRHGAEGGPPQPSA